MKIFRSARVKSKKRKPFLLRRRNEEGSFLVEVLVAGTILVMLAGSAISDLSSLTRLKIQTEARDKGLVLVNSLHESMNSAGCGLNVSAVTDDSVTAPWARVASCDFNAIQSVKTSPYPNAVLDEDYNLSFTDTTAPTIAAFCAARGGGGGPAGAKKCELGDQSFDRSIDLNDSNVTVKFHVTINYWFEKTGVTTPTSACTPFIANASQPDVIARKVTITWANSSTASGKETVTVIKRENIPADKIEFSSNSRVGEYVNTAGTSGVMNIPIKSGANTYNNFQVTRNNAATCVWFPFVDKNSNTSFGKVGGGAFTYNLPGTPDLTNGKLS